MVELHEPSPSHVTELWEKIHPLLDPVLQKSAGSLSIEGIFKELISGRWKLWSIYCPDEGYIAFVAGCIAIAPSGINVLEIKFMCGNKRKKWLPYIPMIEDWAIENECSKMHMIVPKQFAGDLPDYDWTHVFLERQL